MGLRVVVVLRAVVPVDFAAVDREAAGLRAVVPVDFAAVDREAAGLRVVVPEDFAAVDREAAGLRAVVPVDFAAVRVREVAVRVDRVPVVLRAPVERDVVERLAGVAGADSPVTRSSTATRPASDCSSLRTPSSVSISFFSSIDSRTRVTMSSSSSCARPPAAAAPPAAPVKVRSTAPRRASVLPSRFPFFLPFFSCFLAMSRESTQNPIHLRPHEPVAERVLLPGDPGRAMRLAIQLTGKPRMLNHHRGLWGYTGIAPDGELITVQATGMGGPSAAIVVEELIDLGARRLLRVGTCGALHAGFELGELVAAERVSACDGTSRALGAGDLLEPDSALFGALGARPVHAVSTDLFYDPREDPLPAEAQVVEMEAATVLTVAARRGVSAACLLIVSDLLASGERARISEDGLTKAEERLGAAAYAALNGAERT